MESVQKRKFLDDIHKIGACVFIFDSNTFLEFFKHTHSIIKLKIFKELINRKGNSPYALALHVYCELGFLSEKICAFKS